MVGPAVAHTMFRKFQTMPNVARKDPTSPYCILAIRDADQKDRRTVLTAENP